VKIEWPVFIIITIIITEKSSAMFSSLGFGPMNFTKSYEKVQLILGKASLLLKEGRVFLTYISTTFDWFIL
jgi:hypothetical protein